METVRVDAEGYPGYSWTWVEPLQEWVLRWEPVDGVYSPPFLDNSLRWYHVAIPAPMKSPGVLRLQKLKKDFHVEYIVYRPDVHKFEIWSRQLEFSIIALTTYLQSVCPAPRTGKLMPPMPKEQ